VDRADDRDDETYESTGTADESVLAVHGLALVNPRTIKVATNRRVRAVLPPPIDVVSTAEAPGSLPAQAISAEASTTTQGFSDTGTGPQAAAGRLPAAQCWQGAILVVCVSRF